MQRDIVPAIQCIVELHWLGVDLFWWQSHSVVRSRERCVVSLTNACMDQGTGPPFDWVDSVDDWTIDGTHFIVRVRVDYSIVSELTLLASHAGIFTATS
jgi:hypothetical protein